jgi:hypothetical protein
MRKVEEGAETILFWNHAIVACLQAICRYKENGIQDNFQSYLNSKQVLAVRHCYAILRYWEMMYEVTKFY